MSFLMFYQDFPFLEVVKHELSWEPGNTCNPIFCTIKKKVFCFEMFSKAKSLFLVPLMYKHWFFQLWRMNFLSSTMVISFDKVISFDIQTGKWLWVLFLDEVRQILRSCAESLSCSPTLSVVDPLSCAEFLSSCCVNGSCLFGGVHFLLDQRTELHLWSLKVAGGGCRGRWSGWVCPLWALHGWFQLGSCVWSVAQSLQMAPFGVQNEWFIFNTPQRFAAFVTTLVITLAVILISNFRFYALFPMW